MDCLKDYIGLAGVKDGASGLNINSLGGITDEIVGLIRELSEDADTEAVWNDIQKISGRRFYTDCIGSLRKDYKLNRVIEQLYLRQEKGTTEEALDATEARGAYLTFGYPYPTFQAYTLAKVYYQAKAVGTVKLRVVDKDGVTLYSKDAINVIAGINEITVDKTFVANEIFVGVIAEAVSYETDITSLQNTCYCQTIYKICGDLSGYCFPSISGKTFNLTAKTFSAGDDNTHGIGFSGYITCNYEAIICNNKELFCSSWLYLLASQTMTEIISTNRVNSATTVNKAKFEELRDFFTVEYEKQLASAVKGIRINPNEDCCLECNQNPAHVQWLP
jgi:hypothetical protein